MSNMNKNLKLIKGFTKLCYGELAVAIAFIFVYRIITNRYELKISFIDYFTFSILIFILIQGSYLWFYIR